jgi:chorismate-pyruvate lyase
VPEPYQSLLVHQSDMTSTLENFYGETLHVEVLARRSRKRVLPRSGAGAGRQRQKHVEFGAIKIMLDLFPAEARQEILRAQQPLGRILNLFNIGVFQPARAFLRLASDKFIDTRCN